MNRPLPRTIAQEAIKPSTRLDSGEMFSVANLRLWVDFRRSQSNLKHQQ